MRIAFRQTHRDDAEILAEIASRAFAEDERIYGSADPQYGSPDTHRSCMESAHDNPHHTCMLVSAMCSPALPQDGRHGRKPGVLRLQSRLYLRGGCVRMVQRIITPVWSLGFSIMN